MKYSKTNMPLVCMQTNSTCYKGTSIMNVKGVLWHSTGANNPNLKRYIQPSDNAADKESWLALLGKNVSKNDWNHIERQAGLNAWIGKLADGTVTSVQSMPWNFKPWGCGSGVKGSCNNGWIQFEICEDALVNKDYFNAVYKEACELTAYLCAMYGLNPTGIVLVNGVQVPTILCHADASKLGFGSNHADVNHWFAKFGKTMDDVRADVAALMGKVTEVKEMYRVRKNWEDAASQVGAFYDLTKAKEACNKAGKDYEVYNSKGVAIYPENILVKDDPVIETIESFKVGQEVQLASGATYASGNSIPGWLFSSKLYVRKIEANGDIIISTQKTGAITGTVKSKAITPYTGKFATPTVSTTVAVAPGFKSYLVSINTDVLNVRSGAGTGYKITGTVKRHGIFTIVDEKDGWGRLKSGLGWIKLSYTKKV